MASRTVTKETLFGKTLVLTLGIVGATRGPKQVCMESGKFLDLAVSMET